MKTKMNKIILFAIISFLCGNTFAQNEAKNVIRIGAGVNFSDHVSGEKYSMGTALEAEYQRTLSKYVGITANLSTIALHYGKNHDLSDITFAIGTMVTPLPDKFRWVKVGVGLGYCHFVDSYGEERGVQTSDNIYYSFDNYYRNSNSNIGLQFVGRLYFIDNKKYELFASYRLKTYFDSGIEMSNALLCLGFGIKF
jgi:hypothetical protein